jgi:SAM-dependent methyltransferase
MHALDVGCGTGFPLVELADRIGAEGEVHGIDPWAPAVARARDKILRRQVRNAFVHLGSADALPFGDAGFDLVVSNLGLNNFDQPDRAMRESRRVARPGATLAFSTNLQGTFAELYAELPAALAEAGVEDAAGRVAEHVATRTTIDRAEALLKGSGWKTVQVVERSFRMRWASGAALVGHSFIRLGFRPAWEELAPQDRRAQAMANLAHRLDRHAATPAGLVLTVPLACIVAVAE